MRRRGLLAWQVLLGLGLSGPAMAQPEAGGLQEPPRPWSLGASLSWYFVPEGQNFGLGTATADHGGLHLEARYNYEALRTGSAFIGWTVEFGDTVTLALTPMAGCMVGDAGGPILGLEVALGWGPFSFSSQDEWVYDFRGGGGYFYAWTELDLRPWEWLRAGVVVQRTRVFHTAREVIFGPLLGVTVWKLDFTGYWFQPGGVDQTFVVSVGVSF
jgi:hypothetical protein